MNKGFFWLLTLAGLMWGAAATAGPGSISGSVAVTNGEPLPGVTLTLTGDNTLRYEVSNNSGSYEFRQVDPGNYSLTAELEGFTTYQYDYVEVFSDQNTTLPVITLSPTTGLILESDCSALVITSGCRPRAERYALLTDGSSHEVFAESDTKPPSAGTKLGICSFRRNGDRIAIRIDAFGLTPMAVASAWIRADDEVAGLLNSTIADTAGHAVFSGDVRIKKPGVALVLYLLEYGRALADIADEADLTATLTMPGGETSTFRGTCTFPGKQHVTAPTHASNPDRYHTW